MKKETKIAVATGVAAGVATGAAALGGAFTHFGGSEEVVTIDRAGIRMVVHIDGRCVSPEQLDRWKIRRIRHAELTLGLKPMPLAPADDMLAQLTREKDELGSEEIIRRLNSRMDFVTAGTNVAVAASGGKTVECVTEVDVHGADMNQFLEDFDAVQLEPGHENALLNMSVAPDHYFLTAGGGNRLEVIETVGSNIWPSHFFVCYGETAALNSKRDPFYEKESAGVAKTPDGLVEGGVRHQFHQTDDGFKARLCVEFPVILPRSIVKNHQMHLACEFSNWIIALAERRKAETI